jgi:nicotinamide mononucleotide adenylyltransferase
VTTNLASYQIARHPTFNIWSYSLAKNREKISLTEILQNIKKKFMFKANKSLIEFKF